ncbi:MAG: hypothetical protein OJJ55_19115 [Rhodococcus sp.]|nr:hypothetical protein [Rhodococcus sp. (in: high G+C Gram-positive bacteria)]
MKRSYTRKDGVPQRPDESQVEDYRPGHINAAGRRQQREQGSVNIARLVGGYVKQKASNTHGGAITAVNKARRAERKETS